jgi:hypothetical protein
VIRNSRAPRCRSWSCPSAVAIDASVFHGTIGLPYFYRGLMPIRKFEFAVPPELIPSASAFGTLRAPHLRGGEPCRASAFQACEIRYRSRRS